MLTKKIFYLTAVLTLLVDFSVQASALPISSDRGHSNRFQIEQALLLQDQFKQMEQNIAVMQQKLGDKHPMVASLHEKLGMQLQEAGRMEEARQHYYMALKISDSAYPPNHPQFIVLNSRIGRSYFDEHDYSKANRYFSKAFQIMAQALGTAHEKTVHFLQRWADIYMDEGLYQQAEPILTQTIALLERQHTKQTGSLAPFMTQLERVYAHTQRATEARQIQQKIQLLKN